MEIKGIKLEEIVDVLIDKHDSLKNNNVPYSQWAELVSVISDKIVNPNIYNDGKAISNKYCT